MRSLAGIVAFAVLAAGIATTQAALERPVRAQPAAAQASPIADGAQELAGCPPGLIEPFAGCAARGTGYGDEHEVAVPMPSPTAHASVNLDGYRLRIGDDGRVVGYTPLLGGALTFGRAWPDGYGGTDLPSHLVAHYGLGDARNWREADRVVYRIDPETHAIVATVALLTGQTFTVGQPVPAGYDIYNIPLAYRARWADSEEAHYRYGDGRVYRIDPLTGIVVAAMDIPAIPGNGR